jgi:NADH-quinone oxidoreductase subunit L
MQDYAWLIPILPYLAFFLIIFFGKRLPGRGHEIGIAAIAGSLAISIPVFLQTVAQEETFERSWEWFTFGGHTVEIGYALDGLAAVMLLVVCVVSLMVQVYSTEYMRHEPRYTFYFAALSLFTGSMLNLVMANNLAQLLIGWEGVGLCSYLLIGHWFEEKVNSDAAIKAFIVTRTGDVGFTFGIFVLFFAAGTFDIGDIGQAVGAGTIAKGTLTVAAVLVFMGAIGKSAQVPLHVWLPDAMAGPTPVSALIHAATMVVAGVYLVARMYTIFDASAIALNEVAIIGAITMLIAALLALVQDDIKRVLAYSTVSQLAYMVAALGVGGYTGSIFHIWTHAWFKALLFLGAGSVIHAVHTNYMSQMGGLKDRMPTTFATYLVGCLALAGIPPLAGFWSKDSILVAAYHSGRDGSTVGWFVLLTMLLTVFLTACYVARMLVLTFFGKPKYDTAKVHPHEPSTAMTAPLIALAVLSLVGGWVGLPGRFNLFGHWVFFGQGEEAFVLGLALLSAAMAVAGLAFGWWVFALGRLKVDLLKTGWAWAYRLVQNKYYLDDLYFAAIVRPIRDPIARFADWSNQNILDWLVNAAGVATRGTGNFAYYAVDQPVIDGAVTGLAISTGAAGNTLKFWQSGNIQRYAVALFLGVTAFVAAFIVVRF